MKHLILPLALCASFMAFFAGCKKTESSLIVFDPDQALIKEARSRFQRQVLNTPSPIPGPNPRITGAKAPLWEKAYTMELSIGKAVIVPVHCQVGCYIDGRHTLDQCRVML